MPIYEIPLCVRHINIGNGPKNLQKILYGNINNRGVMITYDNEKDLNVETLEKIQPVTKKMSRFFIAVGYADAFVKAFLKYEGMIVGGSDEYSKAIWVNMGKPIIEFPECFSVHETVHENKSRHFTCGEPMPCGRSIFGWCFIEDSREKPGCPLLYYRKEISDNYKKYIDFAKEVSYKKVKYMLITPNQVDYNQYEFPKIQFIKEEHISINLPQLQLTD